MQIYEYKVVPAPTKGKKGPGIKGPDARFAHGLESAMNLLARDGWEYLRADILPSEERQGLTSTQTVYRSVLVFRRAIESTDAVPDVPLPSDTPEAAVAEEVIEDAKTVAEDYDSNTVSDLESENRQPPEDDIQPRDPDQPDRP